MVPSETGPRSHSGEREVLAWEASGPDVGFRDTIRVDILDILFNGHAGETLCQYPATKLFLLALEHAVDPGSLKAQIEAANAREEGRMV